jgi:photosystem II stability/assembly factor-like uncharacterized protein
VLLVALLAAGVVAAPAPVARAADWELVEASEPALRLFAPASGALFAQTASGLRRSDDGGASWRAVPLPPRKETQRRIVVAVDPTDHTRLFANGEQGVYRATDDAATWTPLTLPSPSGSAVLSIAVSPADHGLVYLSRSSGEGTGTTMWLLRSADGGDSWELVKESNAGPSCAYNVAVFWPHPTDPNRVYRRAGCYRSARNADPLQHSDDRGQTWSEVTAVQQGGTVAIAGGQGAAPDRFYLATHSASSAPDELAMRVFRSEDGLGAWAPVLDLPGSEVNALVSDPQSPDRVFAGASQGPVLASTDGGLSWSPLGMQDLGVVHDLALGVDGQNLYAATDQGVWRYPLGPAE